MFVRGAMLLTALLAGPGLAQELVDPNVFLDAADGNTLTFRADPNGELVGVEQFLSRSRTVWARANGSCSYGKVWVAEDRVCFRYEDRPDQDFCWLTLLDDGDFVVAMPEAADVQRITRITQEPVSCVDAPLS